MKYRPLMTTYRKSIGDTQNCGSKPSTMKKLGHYNLIQTDAGWHSTLCAGNNKVILTSTNVYRDDKEAIDDISCVMTFALEMTTSIRIDSRISKDSKHYFCIQYVEKGFFNDFFKSETYNTKQSMERGIKSVLANAKTTDVRIVDRRIKK